MFRGYVSFREWKTSKLFNLIIWSRYSKFSKRTSPFKADWCTGCIIMRAHAHAVSGLSSDCDMQGKWGYMAALKAKKYVNDINDQFRFSPKHVTPSCFGPNLGRNQPNISLQRQVWALQVAALHNLGKDAPVSDSIMGTCDDMVTWNLCSFLTPLGDIWLDWSYKSNSSIYGPDVQGNASASPKIHIYKNDILRGATSAWLVNLLLKTAGETVVPYTKPLRQQDINNIDMATANAWFFNVWKPHETRSTGSYCPDSDPFSTFQFFGQSIDTPSARNLSLSTSCRARAPLEECKSTWVKTYVANVWRVWFTSREISDRKFFMTFIQVAWNDTIQSVHGWFSRKQHSCQLSERQLIGTAKGGKKDAAWQWKEVSRSPVNALQSLYGSISPNKFSIAMKLVLMTIRIKAILLDLQYSDISSMGKRW